MNKTDQDRDEARDKRGDENREEARNKSGGEIRDKDREKDRLRARIREDARRLPQEAFLCAGEQIAKQLVSLPELRNAGTIFCFVSTPLELDTRGLIQKLLDAGKRVCVPRCTGEGVMDAYVIHDFSELHQGHYDILEPSEEAEKLPPEQIDLALIPALACSRDGSRLGQGGGYYDRYLMRTKALRLALCRSACLLSALPSAPHDCKMDMVLTEQEILRIK